MNLFQIAIAKHFLIVIYETDYQKHDNNNDDRRSCFISVCPMGNGKYNYNNVCVAQEEFQIGNRYFVYFYNVLQAT